MLHWYRLAKRGPFAAHRWCRCSPTESLSRQQRQKLFWLGLAEAAPIIAGAIFTFYTDSKLSAIVAALAAIALTGIVCWCLRHQVPVTRIQLSTPRPNQTRQAIAERINET